MRIHVISLLAMLVALTSPASARTPAELTRRALLAEDFVGARVLAQRIESTSERDELLNLIRQCELDAACDEVSNGLASSPPVTLASPRLESLLDAKHPEPLVSATRARALVDVSKAIIAASNPSTTDIVARLDEAQTKDAQNATSRETLRQAVRDAVVAAKATLESAASRTEVNAIAWRLTDSQTNLTALERESAVIRETVRKSEAILLPNEFLALHKTTEAFIESTYLRATVAYTRMLYLVRNIGLARTQVETSLSRYPTHRPLIVLKVKIEEWNLRHRLMGDKPND